MSLISEWPDLTPAERLYIEDIGNALGVKGNIEAKVSVMILARHLVKERRLKRAAWRRLRELRR